MAIVRGKLAAALYDRRTDRGQTQAAAARECGVSPKSWDNWESRSMIPRDPFWKALSKYIGVDFETFEEEYIPKPLRRKAK